MRHFKGDIICPAIQQGMSAACESLLPLSFQHTFFSITGCRLNNLEMCASCSIQWRLPHASKCYPFDGLLHKQPDQRELAAPKIL